MLNTGVAMSHTGRTMSTMTARGMNETTTACAHSWRWDGDDPYVVCVRCDEVRDAVSGRTIAQLEKDREREQAFNAWMEARRAERAAAARYWALADPV